MQLASFIQSDRAAKARGRIISGNIVIRSAQCGCARGKWHGTLGQGFVETSNVNVVEELVNMIQTQRAYEINSKAITTSDQMLQKLSQI